MRYKGCLICAYCTAGSKAGVRLAYFYEIRVPGRLQTFSGNSDSTATPWLWIIASAHVSHFPPTLWNVHEMALNDFARTNSLTFVSRVSLTTVIWSVMYERQMAPFQRISGLLSASCARSCSHYVNVSAEIYPLSEMTRNPLWTISQW